MALMLPDEVMATLFIVPEYEQLYLPSYVLYIHTELQLVLAVARNLSHGTTGKLDPKGAKKNVP